MNYIFIISSINTHTPIYKKIIYNISYKMLIKKNKNTSNHTPHRGGMAEATPTIKNNNTQPPQKTHKPHTDQSQRFYIILGIL